MSDATKNVPWAVQCDDRLGPQEVSWVVRDSKRNHIFTTRDEALARMVASGSQVAAKDAELAALRLELDVLRHHAREYPIALRAELAAARQLAGELAAACDACVDIIREAVHENAAPKVAVDALARWHAANPPSGGAT